MNGGLVPSPDGGASSADSRLTLVLFLIATFASGAGSSASQDLCELQTGKTEHLLQLPQSSCRLSLNGELSCGNPPTLEFTVSLAEHDCIERAFAYLLDGDLLLLVEFGNFEAGTSAAIRISSDGKQIWRADIRGFNLGEPLLEDAALFVTAVGLIGSLDPTDGHWVWIHEGLYEAFSFGASFEPPRRTDHGVFFRGRPAPGEARQREVLVNPETGEIQSPWGLWSNAPVNDESGE